MILGTMGDGLVNIITALQAGDTGTWTLVIVVAVIVVFALAAQVMAIVKKAGRS